MFFFLFVSSFVFFFFFQAEDGIRDVAVTGVQTCALPIFRQITARRARVGGDIDVAPRKTFGLPEAFLAAGLIFLVLMNVIASVGRSPVQLANRDLVANFLITLFIVFFVAAFLKLRGIDVESL